ncbi:hypothetical protein [Streptomyces sp. CA-111067]|uniref:hypothetical protein n=1 Tax=Streptomyces sp. CA-111067 TaxID=3240046 RepID=UPI003D968D20
MPRHALARGLTATATSVVLEFDSEYVARQIAVKAKYQLWVSGAQKSATSRVLGGCRTQALPMEFSLDVALKS